jgi:hypothetical protein
MARLKMHKPEWSEYGILKHGAKRMGPGEKTDDHGERIKSDPHPLLIPIIPIFHHSIIPRLRRG